MPLPISVFIIAKNEADRIPQTIRSVAGWADEIVVVDSGSDDNTVQIATAMGARVYFNAWKGYGPQKIVAEGLCHNDWLLNLDADEAVSPELEAEIHQLFAREGGPGCNAYILAIKRISRFTGKPLFAAASCCPIRLYNKHYARFRDSTVHDSVVPHNPEEKIGRLKGLVLHYCFRSYSHAIEKLNAYSSMQAEDMYQKGRKPSSLRIFIEPLYAFFRAYIVRRYIFMGKEGFIESVIYAFARTLRLAKVQERYTESGYRNNPVKSHAFLLTEKK